MRRVLVLAIIPLAVGAFVVAEAAGSHHSAKSAPSATAASATGAPPATAARVATVRTRHGSLGTFLVDGSGRTLYLFEKDTSPRSRCSGACAQAWPPLLTTGAPRAAGGTRSALLSTTRRAGGARQVVYHGHPLYRFALDHAPGQTRGQGSKAFGAGWYVVTPAGQKIDTD